MTDTSAQPDANAHSSHTSLYESDLAEFTLLRSPDVPVWRRPQIGALTAVTSRWTIAPEERLLVSLPTGSGKTGVATALPHIARSRRVLVIVPSTELRTQIADAFRSQRDLHRVGAVSGSCPHPSVKEIRGRNIDWTELEHHDVVVALPASISPHHMTSEQLPPPDFFDLLIFDEAHHTPADTWRKILEHFPMARAVLLTATPRRADGKLLPGTHAYHFPLRAAIADGLFHPIRPAILPAPEPMTDEAKDIAIADAVVETLSRPEHESSVALIRAGTVHRGTLLYTMYAKRGLAVELITGSTSPKDRESMIQRWTDGTLRALIAVDMLGEGVDIPGLRVVGYHDKHKSVPATMQFIGRLARANETYPQESVLITVHDEDVYPALKGALRELYLEDSDWVEILPTLIDDDVRREQQDRTYLAAFDDVPLSLSLRSVRPLARASMYEVPLAMDWTPGFSDGVPEALRAGERIIGRQIVYSGLNDIGSQLVVITAEPDQPKWYAGAELRSDVYDLAVVTWLASSKVDKPHLLFVNAQDKGLLNAVRGTLDPDEILRNANPAGLQAAFDTLERLSVSSVGVRNTYAAARGAPAYATFAGSGIDRGLRETDTSSRALGHAMAQVRSSTGESTTAGLAAEKSKYWETRYLGLREYDLFATDLAGRYWFPVEADTGPLLPNVSKGKRTDAFPPDPISAEINPALFGAAYTTPDGTPIESVDIEPSPEDANGDSELYLRVFNPHAPETDIWVGRQTIDGRFATVRGEPLLQRGAGNQTTFPELFGAQPPTIYFLNGISVAGGTTFDPPRPDRFLPDIEYAPLDWTNTNITVETYSHAQEASVHYRVERDLVDAPSPAGGDRWVLLNDGSGEIADHVVIERRSSGRLRVELWHSKPAAKAAAGVRVRDIEQVAQQAAKSRRHITDRGFWHRVGRRLDGQEGPAMRLLSGDLDSLRALSGLDPTRANESVADNPPMLESRIVVVQPGLSISKLRTKLQNGDYRAGQVREYLTFLHNAVGGLSRLTIVCSE